MTIGSGEHEAREALLNSVIQGLRATYDKKKGDRFTFFLTKPDALRELAGVPSDLVIDIWADPARPGELHLRIVEGE